jgi:hypothetical protein
MRLSLNASHQERSNKRFNDCHPPKKAVILSDRRESKDLRLPLSLLLLLRLPLPSIRISVIRSEPLGPQRQVFVAGVGTGRQTFFSSGAPADRSSSVGWSLGVVSRRICFCTSGLCFEFFREGSRD